MHMQEHGCARAAVIPLCTPRGGQCLVLRFLLMTLGCVGVTHGCFICGADAAGSAVQHGLPRLVLLMWRVCMSVTSTGSHCGTAAEKGSINHQPGLIQLLESHTRLCKRPASVLLACCGSVVAPLPALSLLTLSMDFITSTFEHMYFDLCGLFDIHTYFELVRC
jgi:hypothetical protein